MSVEARSLAAKSCTPCRGGVPPLKRRRSQLLISVKRREWSVRTSARRIERTFRFRNFANAFAFVGQVAHLAEAEGHHPDISFGWGYADCLAANEEDQGPARERFHHGGQAGSHSGTIIISRYSRLGGYAARPVWTRIVHQAFSISLET